MMCSKFYYKTLKTTLHAQVHKVSKMKFDILIFKETQTKETITSNPSQSS